MRRKCETRARKTVKEVNRRKKDRRMDVCVVFPVMCQNGDDVLNVERQVRPFLSLLHDGVRFGGRKKEKRYSTVHYSEGYAYVIDLRAPSVIDRKKIS